MRENTRGEEHSWLGSGEAAHITWCSYEGVNIQLTTPSCFNHIQHPELGWCSDNDDDDNDTEVVILFTSPGAVMRALTSSYLQPLHVFSHVQHPELWWCSDNDDDDNDTEVVILFTSPDAVMRALTSSYLQPLHVSVTFNILYFDGTLMMMTLRMLFCSHHPMQLWGC